MLADWSQVDVFSEVAILERFRGQQSVCQLLNYGVEGDSFVLVMRKYPTSLKAWRARITSAPAHHLRLYLHIFADIIAAKQVLCLLLPPTSSSPRAMPCLCMHVGLLTVAIILLYIPALLQLARSAENVFHDVDIWTNSRMQLVCMLAS